MRKSGSALVSGLDGPSGRSVGWWLGRLALAGLLVVAIVGSVAAWRIATAGLIVVDRTPPVFDRRAGELTVNIGGSLGLLARDLAFRLNDGPWTPVESRWPRAEPPDFLIELAPAQLNAGANRLELRASSRLGGSEQQMVTFAYEPSPVALPVTVAWSPSSPLDAQTGHWETFTAPDGTGRVRPVPGEEGWDRILMVTGAFPGGRRVRTDAVFHGGRGLWPARDLPWRKRRFYAGFGLFPLWGGNPDEPGWMPRRGWRFSLVWWNGKTAEVSTSFSQRFAAGEPDDIRMPRPLVIEEGRRYAILAEVWPETQADGSHRAWRQRMKWWPADEPEPTDWLEVADADGPNLPADDYAVALISLNAAVDFGPVVVERFAGPQSE